MAQQIAIGNYPLPAYSYPEGIAAGPDGALWFADLTGSIGRITTAGFTSTYVVPTPNASPEYITAGPDGALWFTELHAGQIGRINTAGVMTEYPALTSPLGITTGPDGALWFTGFTGNNIGRITTSGVVTLYSVPTPFSTPALIAPGPDGALWFTEADADQIGRITTAGVITEYPLPTGSAGPFGITLGPDRALWFTEDVPNKVGRISTAGAITEYPLSQPGYPTSITTGPDGALWCNGEYTIARITTAGAVTEYQLPLPAASAKPGPNAIAVGPDGELWITEAHIGGDVLNDVAEAVFVTANLSVSPASDFYGSKLTFTGSGFARNETVQIYIRGVGSPVIASAMANASGAFIVSAREPQSPFGPRLFLGAGQSSGLLGAASFNVTPRLILNPTSGPPGSPVTAQGYGFGAGEPVDVYWNSVGTLLGSTSADVNGAFSSALTVPAGAAPGRDKIFASGQGTGAEASKAFTVQ